MIPSYIVLNKEVGETPLSVTETWRHEQGIKKEIPLSYAGRLDPMASGKLLVLVGDECKKQKEYTGLDKEYEIEVLLGAHSDTGDVLGLPLLNTASVLITEDGITAALAKEVGTQSREYPVFSSKTVKGKQLFLYALEGTLGTIEIPTHDETIYTIHLDSHDFLSKTELEGRIVSSLSVVPRTLEESKKLGADFRQDEIRTAWTHAFKNSSVETYSILKITVTCGSGTYMRTLAGRIGKSLGTQALALSIHRTKIGRYNPLQKKWEKEF